MLVATGDIWEFYNKGYYVVIPTNLGWKRNGANVMGRGLALQAAKLFPDLPQSYGQACQDGLAKPYYVYEPRLILLPSKPLDEQNPQLSWTAKASLKLIRSGVSLLGSGLFQKVAIPIVGCGNGELAPRDIVPVLNGLLDDRFTLVDLDEDRLPWKGKERCMKCTFKVEDWSIKHRICNACRKSGYSPSKTAKGYRRSSTGSNSIGSD